MRLVAALCMGNEEDRYLEEVLDDLDTYVDNMVILDDASTDGSNEIASSYDKAAVHRSKKSLYSIREHYMKSILWKEILPRYLEEGDWVLAIDCDEIMDPRWVEERDKWLNITNFNTYFFRFIECWGSRDQIRVDATWNPMAGKDLPVIARWMPQVNYIFEPSKFHTGRIPLNQPGPVTGTGYYVIHLGWANEKDIKKKRRFYKEHDKEQESTMINRHYATFYTEPELVPLSTFIPEECK